MDSFLTIIYLIFVCYFSWVGGISIMKVTSYNAIKLPDFLKLPETQVSRGYIASKVIQKPMPKARHSRLQTNLLQAINAIAEDAQLAYGFSELRCTFGDHPLILDIAVSKWSGKK